MDVPYYALQKGYNRDWCKVPIVAVMVITSRA